MKKILIGLAVSFVAAASWLASEESLLRGSTDLQQSSNHDRGVDIGAPKGRSQAATDATTISVSSPVLFYIGLDKPIRLYGLASGTTLVSASFVLDEPVDQHTEIASGSAAVADGRWSLPWPANIDDAAPGVYTACFSATSNTPLKENVCQKISIVNAAETDALGPSQLSGHVHSGLTLPVEVSLFPVVSMVPFQQGAAIFSTSTGNVSGDWTVPTRSVLKPGPYEVYLYSYSKTGEKVLLQQSTFLVP